MTEIVIVLFVILGAALPLLGFVVGWYLTNEHWKNAWDESMRKWFSDASP